MIRKFCLFSLIAVAIGIQQAHARPLYESPAASTPSSIGEGWEVPDNIRNNEYLLESQRLVKLAEEAYKYGDYDTSIDLANEAIYYAELSSEYIAQQLNRIEAYAPITVYENPPEGPVPLPASYTVQSWAAFRDCLWNIAARPWVYGDPNRWRILYDANRSRLPEPDNPDLLEPGIVLDIPSIQGEDRQGMWDPNKTYSPFN